MPTFAIHNGSEITNILVADSLEIAKNFGNGEAFEVTSPIGIGYILIDGKWVTKPPYPSWVLNDNGSWIPPKPYRIEGGWVWDEDLVDWVEVTKET